jgi:hypothetical protein
MWAEDQKVVTAKVDDERYGTDHAELEHLADQDVERPADTTEQRESFCEHSTSVAAETGRR